MDRDNTKASQMRIIDRGENLKMPEEEKPVRIWWTQMEHEAFTNWQRDLERKFWNDPRNTDFITRVFKRLDESYLQDGANES